MTRQLLAAQQIYDESLSIRHEPGLKDLNARNSPASSPARPRRCTNSSATAIRWFREIVAHAFAGMDLEFKPGPDWQTSMKNWSSPGGE